jgi:flagellar basal body-associated protein FliL
MPQKGNQMTAEDKMSRAWMILIVASLVAVLSASALVVWIFWNIASHF